MRRGVRGTPVVPAPRLQSVEVGQEYTCTWRRWRIESLSWQPGPIVMVHRVIDGKDRALPQQVRYQYASVLTVLSDNATEPVGSRHFVRADQFLPSRGLWTLVQSDQRLVAG